MRIKQPDLARLRTMYVELEFHTLARNLAPIDGAVPVAESTAAPVPAEEASAAPPPPAAPRNYSIVDTVSAMEKVVARARKAPYIAIDVETVTDPNAPYDADPLRC